MLIHRIPNATTLRLFSIVSIAVFCPALSVAADAADASSRKPNILFVVADDASYAHFGANGCTWVSTPGFDRVAREGIRFTKAYTPNAKCAPSRSCILTGRNPWQLEAAANHNPVFPSKFKTYCEALADNGYTVASSGKGWGPGRAVDAGNNPRDMVGVSYDRHTYVPATEKMCNIDFGRNFEDFLEEKPEDKPWCFWVGSKDPHRPYVFGSGEANGKRLSSIDRVPGCWPDEESVRHDMLDYALEIENFDRNLLNVLDVLERSGELDDTLVVVTSDNGMPFPAGKGNLYEIATHMPLAVMWRNGLANPGRTVDDFVSFVDFAPTFLDLAGISEEISGMSPMTGRSFRPILESEKDGRIVPERDRVILGRERTDLGRPRDAGYPIRAMIRDGYMYLHNFEPGRWPGGNPETGYMDADAGPTKDAVLRSKDIPDKHDFWRICFGFRPEIELYDLTTDPDCTRNLAAAMPERREAMRKELFACLEEQQDPRMYGKGCLFDEYPHFRESLRGLYERRMSEAAKNAVSAEN